MAIITLVSPANMDRAKYDNLQRKLEQSGKLPPDGLLMHVAFGDEKKLQIFNVWDSKEHFERFLQYLKPVAQELGVTMGDIEIKPVHNLIRGHAPV